MTVIDRDKCLWIPLLFIFCAVAFAANGELPKKPPGKFFPLRARDHRSADSFKSGQPIVGTSYFYWYDIDTKTHIIDHGMAPATSGFRGINNS
jgi:hypothetical protein